MSIAIQHLNIFAAGHSWQERNVWVDAVLVSLASTSILALVVTFAANVYIVSLLVDFLERNEAARFGASAKI